MPDKKTTEGLLDRIWKFFTSLKLVIVLLLLLSAFSIIGTVIEQNKPLAEYYGRFSPQTVEIFLKLGLTDMYHSWWFTACLALLALNIIACTMERYPSLVKAMKGPGAVLDEKLQAGLPKAVTLKYSLPPQTIEERAREIVAKGFGSSPVATEAGDAHHLFYEKGRYTRLAFFLTHLSVLVIFLGAIMGSLFGFKGYVNIHEGETISSLVMRQGKERDLGFAVKCNSFAVDFYPNGMPKDYRSDISILEGGREVMRRIVRVNDPLSYKGITFYQSSYGSLPEQVTFAVSGKGSAPATVSAPFGRAVSVPGTDLTIEVLDFREHFHFSDGSEAGPVYGVNVYRPGAAPEGIWVSAANQEMNRLDGYLFVVKDASFRKFTGLQVAKDPGVWVVWIGCILLVAGIMMAFFLSHQRLWIRIGQDKKGRTELVVAGSTNKNRYAFEKQLEGLIARLREVS